MSQDYQNMNLFDFIRLCCRGLAKFFVWIFNCFMSLIQLCFRYWYIMVICVVLGFFAARVWMKPRFTKYYGTATMVFPAGMKPVVEEGLLVYLSQSNDFRRDVLGLPDSIQCAMRGFYTYNSVDAKSDSTIDYIDFKSKVDYEDTLNTIAADRLTLKIIMRGQSDFSNYQYSLIRFYEFQEMYTEPAERARKRLNERIDYLNHEIERTDAYIDRQYAAGNSRSSVSITPELSMAAGDDLYADDMAALLRERQFCEEQLCQIPKVVNFQTPFYISFMQPRDKYITCGIIAICFGIALSLIIKYWSAVFKFISKRD